MTKTAVPLFLLLLFGFLSSSSQDIANLSQENGIREAVFRYEFEHNASGLQKRAYVFCISVGYPEADPTTELLKRFHGNKPPVLKASACGYKNEIQVVEIRTGKPSLIFTAGDVRMLSSNIAQVTGGYFEGNVSSSGNTYRVENKVGKWVVTKDEMNSISELIDLALVNSEPLVRLTTCALYVQTKKS